MINQKLCEVKFKVKETYENELIILKHLTSVVLLKHTLDERLKCP